MTASNRLLGHIQRLMITATLALGSLSQASAGETITFFHNDIAGSPMLATDVNGLVAWKEHYRPYGDRVVESIASTSNALWYTGKSHDEETGLTYMGARYYDPAIGRFMGIDPAPIDFVNLHGINRFTYANNNPYKFVDPDGRQAVAVAFVPEVITLCTGPQASACAMIGGGIVLAAAGYYGSKYVYDRVFSESDLGDATASAMDESSEDADSKLSEGKGRAPGRDGDKGVLIGSGGREQAESDFDGVDGEEVDTGKEGVRVKILGDGGRVETHDSTGKNPNVKAGTRTIKIHNSNGDVIRTIRYPQ